jgi:branched-chain amino acid transport system substrate-binding protein
VIGLAALGLAACGSTRKTTAPRTTSSTGSASKPTLKLGFIGSVTGTGAQLGINIENGEELAVSQYGTGDPAVNVIVDRVDIPGNPSQARSGAVQLVNDKVVGVISPALADQSTATDALFESAGIPNVSASVTSVALAANGWKFFHRVIADDADQGRGDADYLVRSLGDKTVAVIDDGSAYGESLDNAVRVALKTNGGRDSVNEGIDVRGDDFAPTLNQIIVAKPSAVFFGGYYVAAARLVKLLRAAGYHGAFMSDEGSDDPHFVADAAGAAQGAYLSCACAYTAGDANAEAFNSAYRAAFGAAPGVYSAEAYDATNFLLAAIKSGATTAAAINTYLATSSYTGITKTIRFQVDGNVSGGMVYVSQVKSGQIEQIGTTS